MFLHFSNVFLILQGIVVVSLKFFVFGNPYSNEVSGNDVVDVVWLSNDVQ